MSFDDIVACCNIGVHLRKNLVMLFYSILDAPPFLDSDIQSSDTLSLGGGTGVGGGLGTPSEFDRRKKKKYKLDTLSS